MDKVTRQMKADGAYMEILKKYKSKVGEGYPFKSQLDESYLAKHGFCTEYDKMPDYEPE